MQRTQSALSLLRLEAGDRSEMLGLIAEAERGSEELSGLFAAAREYVRADTIEASDHDVVSLIDEAWRSVIEPGTDATLEIEPTTLIWPVDPMLLRSALQEILRNSLEARPFGLRVRVRSRELGCGTDRRLELGLADNGPGLTDVQRERALEPFWSGRAGARGIGLTLARKLIEAHGGTLSLTENQGGGVVATIGLPGTPGWDGIAAQAPDIPR